MAAKNKSYLNNPALHYISTALVNEANAEPEAVKAAPEPAPKPARTPKPPAQPAPEPQAPVYDVPMKPVYVEVRSKRFNALLQPSLYRSLSRIAAREEISVNELMHRALESYVAAHAEE